MGNKKGRAVVLHSAVVVFESERQESCVFGNGFSIYLVDPALVGHCFRQHAHCRLPVIASQRISHKHHPLVPDPFQHISCIEPGKNKPKKKKKNLSRFVVCMKYNPPRHQPPPIHPSIIRKLRKILHKYP